MNFNEVLNTRASDIQKPPTLPSGTYVWKVSKLFKESQIGSGSWQVIDIPIVPISPDSESDDIDPDLLEEFGNLSAGVNSIRFMFPTEPDRDTDRLRTANQLKKFLLDVLQVDGDDDTTIKELLAKSVGCEFRAQAIHRPVDDNVYVDVKNWMPAA